MQNHLAAVFGAARWLTQLGGIVLIGAALASPAAASPIVYTMQGTLTFNGAGDPLSLNGARLVIAAILDTEDAPPFTGTGSGLATATYQPLLGASFSNRPGGAPDVVLTYTTLLQVANFFPPSSSRDTLQLFADSATFEGNAVTMPAFSVFFFGQTYLPGTGTPSLPLFAPADVQTLAAGSLSFSQGSYLTSDRSFTAAVPEPAMALCVALGLSVLGVVRRR